MVLTSDQTRAFEVVCERLQAGARFTSLTGYAGTGKTTLIAHLTDYLLDQDRDVYVATPTHKSAQVLRDFIKLDARPQTIHSFLGLQLRPDGAGGYALRWDRRTQLPEGGIVVVDEASMIGRAVWAHVEAADHLQWVFVGDPAQLPPVREDPSPALTVPGVHLDAIVRQAAGNPILRMATAIREGRPYLHTSDFADGRGVATTTSARKFIDSIARAYAGRGAGGPPEVRVLAYRNAVVQRYNAALRARLYAAAAAERFVPGEWLMMSDTFFQSGRSVAHNSEELLVEGIEEGSLPLVGQWWRTHVIEARLGTDTVTLPVLHEQEEARYRAMLASLREEAAGGKKTWADYFTTCARGSPG